MANILCVTNGLAGILFSSLELVRRLSNAGHRVVYASFSSARLAVEACGLELLELPKSEVEEFLRRDRERGWIWRGLRTAERREQALESLRVRGFADTVRETAADLLLIDGEMHEHVISASASGVPIALLNTFSSIWKRPGLPPPHHLVRPGRGLSGSRVGLGLLWELLRLRKRLRALRLRLACAGCDRLSLLRRLAVEAGFDFRGETDFGQWLIPFTYRRLPVLSLHAREFEFPHQPPDHVHYVGPMVSRRRPEPPPGDRVAAELEETYRRAATENGKLIYAGFGSFSSTDRSVLRQLVEAVRGHPDWQLVASVGEELAPSALGELPANVATYPWVPQPEVLQHAHVAVVHGGINTIDECVLAGVPMLVYCAFETDMAGNTARVEHHGIGIAGDPRHDSAESVRSHLERLSSEPGFARRLGALRASYLAYEENGIAESVVESLLSEAGR